MPSTTAQYDPAMNVDLAYGRGRLPVEFPDGRTTVLEPSYVAGLPDEAGAIRHALRMPTGTAPLASLVGADQTVAISVCDITRPMPSHTLLPVLLGELAHVPDDRIVILIAAGTHRPNDRAELVEMLGEPIVDRYPIVNHSAFDEEGLVHLGEVEPHVPVWLNRRWVEADFRITTGFVEPHFFAGFSGGPKLVAPGLAGLLDQAGHLPSFLEVTDGKTGDVPAARTWTFPAGSVVVFDRAYLDFQWLAQLQAGGVTFVTRLKRGVRYRVLRDHDVKVQTGMLSDQTIELSSARGRKAYPDRLRRIRYWDREARRSCVFLTNNTTWVAKTIADVYKSRWQIELFFKWIKQHGR